MLSSEQIESYRENGYIGVEGVFSQSEVAELRRVTDGFVEQSRSVSENDDVFDLEPGHTAEEPRLRRLKNPANQHEVYKQAQMNARLLDIVEQLVGKGVRCNGHKLNIKAASFGSPVEWHQDWAFYPHTNDDLLAVGIAIDPMTRENGCLLILPGTHRGRIYDHHQEGHFAGAVTEPDFDPEGAVPVKVGAGGISIHHARVLHGSIPNTSPNPRRLLLFQYCALDAWPLAPPVTDWDAFNATILRGDPTCEPRLADVPVRMPLPPPIHAGSIYEIQTSLRNPHYAGKQAAS